MAMRIPDLLTRELRHHMERLQDRVRQVGLRQWINESHRLMIGVTCLCVLLLVVVAARTLRPAPQRAFRHGERAWFYDANTGKLFTAGFKQVGPIAAPSGPAPGGELAGFRVHVYSYVLDPNENDLVVGFLEQPDPEAPRRASASDMRDMSKWAQSRLIRRVKDKQWVRVMSPEGRAIMEELMEPNEKGQTPVSHMPK
jgi:heme A synthase